MQDQQQPNLASNDMYSERISDGVDQFNMFNLNQVQMDVLKYKSQPKRLPKSSHGARLLMKQNLEIDKIKNKLLQEQDKIN